MDDHRAQATLGLQALTIAFVELPINDRFTLKSRRYAGSYQQIDESPIDAIVNVQLENSH
jgi:hypothetical protein